MQQLHIIGAKNASSCKTILLEPTVAMASMVLEHEYWPNTHPIVCCYHMHVKATQFNL